MAKDGVNLNNGVTAVPYGKRGAEATKRRLERDKRTGDARVRRKRESRAMPHLDASADAVCALAAALGYPTPKEPTGGWIHRLGKDDDDAPDA